MKIITILKPVSAAFTLALLLGGCGGDIGETAQEKEARDKAAATSQNPVTSCSWNQMAQLRYSSVAQVDEADVCTMMQSSLGHLPSVALLRKLSMVVFIFKVVGSNDSAKEIAYQIMNVVEARGQINDDAAIDESFETVQKIFNTTHGHVTPKDLNVALRGPGLNAHTIDQQGMFTVAAMIWEAKKANGE